MNWNPFKRIAALESRIAYLTDLHDQNVERINDLTFKLQALHRDYVSKYDTLLLVLKDHDERLVSPQNKDPKAEKRREYARKYYAKKRAAKAAEGGAK
jgi:hypothetical protein